MTQKLIAPEGHTSVTFEGESFEVVDGIVEVPAQAVAVLFSHGYAPWFQKNKRAPKKDKQNPLGNAPEGDENSNQDNEGDGTGDQEGNEGNESGEQ
ncbi:hypothetical protein [Polynucleobacter sp. AP-RePozz3-80-G7]|uniref:hypothetical protein n=1 Tax=Polynucleobacter sp. AP-RePozz3-80-G7 TaxID=2689105 RepID=UPI001C0AAD18|nr:hypothetical protein [Polynucleobacter sp. AP-RePozz3-80-G7]MBU3640010.1 hypothetical protein [Polynucleobacter sp. AP-RePozz3-80-G7]